MCSFKSALWTRDGRLLWSDYTDVHEDLIALFEVHDENAHECANFVRLEYTPNDDFTAWALVVDEKLVPAWFDDDASARAALDAVVQRMIVRDARPILCGGQWVLLDGADVGKVISSQIVTMCGSARVRVMRGSASVGEMGDSASVGEMWDYASVGVMWGSASVGKMRDSTHVGVMSDSASVNHDNRKEKTK